MPCIAGNQAWPVSRPGGLIASFPPCGDEIKERGRMAALRGPSGVACWVVAIVPKVAANDGQWERGPVAPLRHCPTGDNVGF